MSYLYKKLPTPVKLLLCLVGEGGYRKIDEPNDEQLKFTRSLGQDRYIITQQIISTALAELAL